MFLQVLQKIPYFGMADYYSLGIIVYVMAVGGHPYLSGDESLEETIKIVTTVELDYPEDMDTNLRDIIKRVSLHRAFIFYFLRDKVLSR